MASARVSVNGDQGVTSKSESAGCRYYHPRRHVGDQKTCLFEGEHAGGDQKVRKSNSGHSFEDKEEDEAEKKPRSNKAGPQAGEGRGGILSSSGGVDVAADIYISPSMQLKNRRSSSPSNSGNNSNTSNGRAVGKAYDPQVMTYVSPQSGQRVPKAEINWIQLGRELAARYWASRKVEFLQQQKRQSATTSSLYSSSSLSTATSNTAATGGTVTETVTTSTTPLSSHEANAAHILEDILLTHRLVPLRTEKDHEHDDSPPSLHSGKSSLSSSSLSSAATTVSSDLLLPSSCASIGSLLHEAGVCKPCVFANKNAKTCRNDRFCYFCHHPHKERRKRQRQQYGALVAASCSTDLASTSAGTTPRDAKRTDEQQLYGLMQRSEHTPFNGSLDELLDATNITGGGNSSQQLLLPSSLNNNSSSCPSSLRNTELRGSLNRTCHEYDNTNNHYRQQQNHHFPPSSSHRKSRNPTEINYSSNKNEDGHKVYNGRQFLHQHHHSNSKPSGKHIRPRSLRSNDEVNTVALEAGDCDDHSSSGGFRKSHFHRREISNNNAAGRVTPTTAYSQRRREYGMTGHSCRENHGGRFERASAGASSSQHRQFSHRRKRGGSLLFNNLLTRSSMLKGQERERGRGQERREGPLLWYHSSDRSMSRQRKQRMIEGEEDGGASVLSPSSFARNEIVQSSEPKWRPASSLLPNSSGNGEVVYSANSSGGGHLQREGGSGALNDAWLEPSLVSALISALLGTSSGGSSRPSAETESFVGGKECLAMALSSSRSDQTTLPADDASSSSSKYWSSSSSSSPPGTGAATDYCDNWCDGSVAGAPAAPFVAESSASPPVEDASSAAAANLSSPYLLDDQLVLQIMRSVMAMPSAPAP